MTELELKNKIKFAYSSLTGKDSISGNYGRGIMGVFGHFDDKGVFAQKSNDEVVEATLKSAPMVYSGSKSIPELSFWKNLRSSKQRDYNVKNNIVANEYVKPTEGEKTEIAIQARGITEKFESMTKSFTDDEKPNLYTAKVKRYRQYVADKLVRVDQEAEFVDGVHVPAHALHSQWILKAQALNMCVKYHCPVEWLTERGINI